MRQELLISHPGSLQLLYGIFAAAAQAGWQPRLWTGYHFDERGLIERLAARAPGGLAPKLMRELRRRGSDAVPPEAVVRLPWLELPTVAALRSLPRLGSLPRLLGLRNAVFDAMVAREVRRHPPALVMPVDSAALTTIRAARAAGVPSLLNQTIGHVAVGQRILMEEAVRHPDWADSMPLELPPRLVERARREALEADGILAPSDYVERTLIEIGVPAERIFVLPYGVRTDRFTPARPPARKAGPFRILYVGQISQRKGLAYLLEAVRRLGRPDIELLLVGSIIGAGRGLRSYEGHFRHLANRPHGELAEIYRSADLFAYPSLHEGSAQAIMEAMACGLPVVATEVGGVPDLVEQGETGWLIRHEDFEGTARMAARMLADPAMVRRMGAKARKRAVERFSLDASVERVAQVLTRLVPARSEQRRMGAVAREQGS
jgi:glycosyltransferase involved in cell wall biosynthesis